MEGGRRSLPGQAAESGGFMSEELLVPRAELYDENFDRFLAEKTGLLDLKV